MRLFTILIVLILFTGLLSCKKKETKNPPEAIFTVAPNTGPFTLTFVFNAEGSRDDNEPTANLKVRWDFDGDGIFDTEFSTTKTAEYKYEEADNYAVGMEVVNSEGWTDYEGKTIVVYSDSVPPGASFFIEPDSSSTNTVFLVNAAASSDQYTPPGELQFRWDWESDGSWDTPFFTDSTFYHKYDLSGNYRVLLEVKNNISLTDTTSRKVIVYDL